MQFYPYYQKDIGKTNQKNETPENQLKTVEKKRKIHRQVMSKLDGIVIFSKEL